MNTINTIFSTRAMKFWVAAAAAVLIVGLTAWQTAMGDNVVTPQEWATVVIAIAGAVGVYVTKNSTD